MSAAGCVRKVLSVAKLVTLADLRSVESAAKVETVLREMTAGRGRGGDSGTNRMHARELWRRKKLIDHDQLGGVDLPAQSGEGKRRALAPAGLSALIDTATNSAKDIRDLTGPHRVALYLTAASTGFRAGELAALEPDHFHLDADPPFVALSGKYTKNGKDAIQPLLPAVVAKLRPLLVALVPRSKVWAGSRQDRSADMFRDDLGEANIPVVVNGEHTVFHSLRHTYATMLGRSPPIKVVQELDRHSTPVLTIGRYGHTDMTEKAEAVARLPIPGSAHTSPFAHLTRTDLERLTASLALTLAAVTSIGGGLVVRRVVPEVEPAGYDLGCVETTRPGSDPRPSRRRA